ncbi:MAG TPA: AIPR family protein [Candidatus Paceibacterota bacterium]|nr:AIPR family protein [Candidatus Paceibacterota bacterium]
MRRKKEYYDTLSSLAVTAEAGGLAKDRAVLLLWFFRNVVGVDDLDAYEYVCDGDLDGGVDALYLERSTGDDNFETLVIYQSKYTEGPTMVGETAVDRLVSIASRFKTETALRDFLTGSIEDKLRSLVERFRLLKKLAEGQFDSGQLRVRLVLVTSGILNGKATQLVEATNQANHDRYLTVYDLRRLGPLAVATTTPQTQLGEVWVPTSLRDRLIIGSLPNRVAVAAVCASDIVKWPGIDDRTLFDLNVRREIRLNPVRRQLDSAIRRTSDHRDFLAYHNGLTVTCRSFREGDAGLSIADPSVVNGGQSVVALHKAASLGTPLDDLKLFVKFVEVQGRPQLAREVSRRSNTQNPVNPRNLVSLGGPQERLASEFAARYPDIYYETRPDASLRPKGRMIKNDDAAQLLCAVYNARPWLAVKPIFNSFLGFPEDTSQ